MKRPTCLLTTAYLSSSLLSTMPLMRTEQIMKSTIDLKVRGACLPPLIHLFWGEAHVPQSPTPIPSNSRYGHLPEAYRRMLEEADAMCNAAGR